MKRLLFPLVLVATLIAATPVSAQTIGTFRWRVAPFCSVINITVTQVGSNYTLAGFEEQCGNNPRLPVYGAAIVQPNGQIWLGFTTVFDFGNGLHTRATIASNLSGNWHDNGNQSGTFEFNPGPGPFTGGPRITPIEPDMGPPSIATQNGPESSTIDALQAEVADLKKLVAEIVARSKQ